MDIKVIDDEVRWTDPAARGGREPGSQGWKASMRPVDLFRQDSIGAFLDEIHQLRVHEGVVIRDIEDVDVQIRAKVGELREQPSLVLGLHHQD